MSQGVQTGSEKTFFGHPRGLATLFTTELWERFSYFLSPWIRRHADQRGTSFTH